MRDNYVGDIGDYYKYSLLRSLCSGQKGDRAYRKLGVVWCLYPDPCKKTDGLHLSYLTDAKRDEFRPIDPELYDKLKQLVQVDHRSVRQVREYGILPAGTVFYEEPLSFEGMAKGHKLAIGERKVHRQAWLERALEVTKDCDLVFFDPDNGLQVKSTASHHDRGPKFIYYDELLPFLQRGQSPVIYQHKNMHETAEVQITTRKRELQECLLRDQDIEVEYYPRFGGRMFFMCKQK